MRPPRSSTLVSPRNSIVSKSAGDLSRALQQLPSDQQEVVRLHFVEELSFEEIGEKVGASTGAVRVRAHRGYTALRKLLAVSNISNDIDIDKGRGP